MELTARTWQNDIRAFRALFEEHYAYLVRTGVYYVNDVAIAEDLVQEVFTVLWEKRERLHGVEHVKGYLQNAVKNRCLNYIQHVQVVDSYQKQYMLQELTEGEECAADDTIQEVRRLLAQLPEKRRVVIELSVMESKSYQEIADILGISVNTVKDHIKKAYAFLRKEYGQVVSPCLLYMAFSKKA